ncbi:hypothetical protein TSUD_385700 [Trifolium subterraneum]|uniref:Uncharacterized protein n=1 Tax=Trifolium subterraneum TaxID=3900 RepID=A0A2Z6MDV6_TRISU|nr:hypothetical protein TSUD_385700 [Trifolium subterraneum]
MKLCPSSKPVNTSRNWTAPFHRFHFPPSWFQPSGNVLAIFEEKSGDLSKIRFVTQSTSSMCPCFQGSPPLCWTPSSVKFDGG